MKQDPFSIPYGYVNRDYNSIDERPVGTQVKVNNRWYEKKSDDNYYLFIKLDVDAAKKSLKKFSKRLAKLWDLSYYFSSYETRNEREH